MKRTKIFTAFCTLVIFCILLAPVRSYSNCTSLLKEVNVTTDGAKNIVLNSFTGNFTVTGSDIEADNNAVSMKIYGDNDDMDRFNVETGNNGSTLLMDCKKTNLVKDDDYSDPRFNIVVSLPKKSDLSIKTGSGNVTVKNIDGKLRMYSAGGNLEVSGVSENVYAVTGGGNVTTEKVDGSINIITGGGNINVFDFKSTVIALTDGGNIFLKGSNAAVNVSTGGGNIDLDYTGKNYGMVLNSTAGNINLNVPKDFGAELNLLAQNGKISGDVEVQKNKNFLQKSLNGGGKKLYCLTETGNIILTIKGS